MPQFSFKIEEHIGTLSHTSSGWTKELNLVSWGDQAPRFDLRNWAPDHEKMGKGLTLTNDEVAKLREILNEMQ